MIKIFLISEIIGFAGAALVHFGILINGYEHEKAGIAESVIALVLLIGFIIISLNPERLKITSYVVQGFALFGTLIGVFTMIVGVGPQSMPDKIFHVCISIILITGLILTAKLSV